MWQSDGTLFTGATHTCSAHLLQMFLLNGIISNISCQTLLIPSDKLPNTNVSNLRGKFYLKKNKEMTFAIVLDKNSSLSGGFCLA